ncbi:MAG: outer-membrane lipoprotein carrier protein LolA [Ghiorsea sp.]
MPKILYFCSFMLLVSFLGAGKVAAATELPTSELEAALNSLSKLEGFSTQFKQVISYANGGERVYQGNLSILRPGKFRWAYTKPYEQLYVSNGQGIWLYEPDLLQAQLLQDLGEVDPIVLQLLDGRINFDDVKILDEKHEDGLESAWFIRMGTKDHAVEVWVGTHDNQLVWIESRDTLSNRNRLQLIHMNTMKPAENIFEFIAPKGVDVIGAIQ